MTKLSKSQKKGKNSIYNGRFLKNKEKINSYNDLKEGIKYTIVKFSKCTKSNSIIAKISSGPANKSLNLIAPEKIKLNTSFIVGQKKEKTDTLIIKSLKDYSLGDRICAIQRDLNKPKYICSSAGAFATIFAFKSESKTVVLLVNKRKIELPENYKAAYGIVSNSNFNLKPIPKAGIASKISYAKGKKYPLVSEHKKNCIDSCLGGKHNRNKVIICVKHTTNPKTKTGHISPKRTGKSK